MKMAGLESMAMVVEEVKPLEKPVDREKVLSIALIFDISSTTLTFLVVCVTMFL